MPDAILDLGRCTWEELNKRVRVQAWHVHKDCRTLYDETLSLHPYREGARAERQAAEHGMLIFMRSTLLRTRYFVAIYEASRRSSAQFDLNPTLAEIRYQKSRRKWLVLIDGLPINTGYTRLQSAKASLSQCVLTRIAAEDEPG